MDFYSELSKTWRLFIENTVTGTEWENINKSIRGITEEKRLEIVLEPTKITNQKVIRRPTPFVALRRYWTPSTKNRSSRNVVYLYLTDYAQDTRQVRIWYKFQWGITTIVLLNLQSSVNAGKVALPQWSFLSPGGGHLVLIKLYGASKRSSVHFNFKRYVPITHSVPPLWRPRKLANDFSGAQNNQAPLCLYICMSKNKMFNRVFRQSNYIAMSKL